MEEGAVYTYLDLMLAECALEGTEGRWSNRRGVSAKDRRASDGVKPPSSWAGLQRRRYLQPM